MTLWCASSSKERDIYNLFIPPAHLNREPGSPSDSSRVFSLFIYSFSKYLLTTYYVPRWRRQWHPTPVLLPGKSLGWRSLVGCSPWGRYESDTTEWLHFHFSLSCIGEGNGNPLQCSCLENPRDGGAWWTAVYGVAQNRTRLKWLSSSSMCPEPCQPWNWEGSFSQKRTSVTWWLWLNPCVLLECQELAETTYSSASIWRHPVACYPLMLHASHSTTFVASLLRAER